MKPQFVLASASTARAHILQSLGIDCIVEPSDFDEDNYHERRPIVRAEHLAQQKALAVKPRFAEHFIIGGDTLIESANGELYEKPNDAEQAKVMLESYRNAHCLVHSSLALVAPDGTMHSAVQTSTVYWGPIPEKQLEAWLDGEVWKGRSGGFKLGAVGQIFAKKIEGEFNSIAGFSTYLFGQLLEKHGLNVEEIISFSH